MYVFDNIPTPKFRFSYRSERDFFKGIDSYIVFYNEKRSHSYLQYKTPENFERMSLNKGIS